MVLTRTMNLSPTMIEAIEMMEKHGKLVRYPGGAWSWAGVEIKHEHFERMDDYDVPTWYCDVKTLRALDRRGVIELDEIKNFCKLNCEEPKQKEGER